MSSSTGRRGRSDSAIWQEVEFGSYSADIALWIELAESFGDPVLELGAGAGRVALELASRGHRVLTLERDATLAEGLERAAEEQRLDISVFVGDLDSPDDLQHLEQARLAIGPLHVIQLVDPGIRPALLGRLGELLAPGATLTLTLVDEATLLNTGTAAPRILPDMKELDGWVYSSEPLWVQVGDQTLTVRRLRERVDPGGRMDRSVHDDVLHRLSPERLEDEAVSAGLTRAGRRRITYGPNEADSVVVFLEASR
jgi:hypothetical protein